MRLVDADIFDVVGTKIPDGMDAESYMAGMDFVLNEIDNAPTIEPEIKFIRLPNDNPVDMFPLLTEEEKQQSREYAQGFSDALAELRKKGKWIRLTKDLAQCPKCGDYIDNATRCGYNFCPNCGAGMET